MKIGKQRRYVALVAGVTESPDGKWYPKVVGSYGVIVGDACDSREEAVDALGYLRELIESVFKIMGVQHEPISMS